MSLALLTSFPPCLCPLSLLSFWSDSDLIFLHFLRLFFLLALRQVLQTSTKSNNVTCASIILPVACCCVGEKNACTNFVCVLSVCVSVFLPKKQAASERVSLWAGFLGETAACSLGKHQSEWLCSSVSSPATASPLQDRLHQPTPAKVSTCAF